MPDIKWPSRLVAGAVHGGGFTGMAGRPARR
jgi:hypothetical protein